MKPAPAAAPRFCKHHPACSELAPPTGRRLCRRCWNHEAEGGAGKRCACGHPGHWDAVRYDPNATVDTEWGPMVAVQRYRLAAKVVSRLRFGGQETPESCVVPQIVAALADHLLNREGSEIEQDTADLERIVRQGPAAVRAELAAWVLKGAG